MSPLFDTTPAGHELDALLAYRYPTTNLSPVICTPHAASRSSRADAFRAMLRDIEETRTNVAVLEEKIRRLALGLRRRKAAVNAALQPVSGLPTELLVEIFKTVAAKDRFSLAQVTLSHVSSLWRDVALDTKELWARIQVPPRSPEIVHEFAKRSGSLRLELSTLRTWPEGLELTSEEASRLSVLVLYHEPSSSLRGSLHRHAPMMRLDKLILHGPGKSYNLSMCSASVVELHNTSAYGRPNLHIGPLISLVLNNCSPMIASETLESIAAPVLSRLELANIGRHVHGDVNDLQLHGYDTQITAFTLVQCEFSVYFHIFTHWRMPNLVSLTLDFGEGFWRPGELEQAQLDSLVCVHTSYPYVLHSLHGPNTFSSPTHPASRSFT